MLYMFIYIYIYSYMKNFTGMFHHCSRVHLLKEQFAYRNNKTLVSYRSKNDETILLLSSLHPDGKINKMKNKPEIAHYNKTEGASI